MHVVSDKTEAYNRVLRQRHLEHLSSGGTQQGTAHDCWSDGPTVGSVSKVKRCIGCDRGKLENRSFKPINKKDCASCRLQALNTDVCDLFRVKSLGHSAYILTIIDDYSRMTFVYFLKHKSELDQRGREFVAYVERQTGDKIRHLRSDSGREFG